MNIALINCRKTTETCSVSGCFRAVHERTGSFEQYTGELQVFAATDCSGCEGFTDGHSAALEKKLNRMHEIGVERVHFGKCVCKPEKCPHFNELTQAVLTAGMICEFGTH